MEMEMEMETVQTPSERLFKSRSRDFNVLPASCCDLVYLIYTILFNPWLEYGLVFNKGKPLKKESN